MTAEITRINTAAEAKLIDQFKAAQAGVPAVPGFDREAAFARFSKKGLPHRRIEAWHYTDLRSIMREAHAPAPAPTADVLEAARAYVTGLPAAAGARFVLVDGHAAPDLSSGLTQAGLAVRSLIDVLGEGQSDLSTLLAAQGMAETEAVLALNAAFMQGGAVVTVEAGVSVEHPVEIVVLASATHAGAITTRSLIKAGEKSHVVVLERYGRLGKAAVQANHALILSVGDHATVDHVVVDTGTDASVQTIVTLLGTVGAEANLKSFALYTGSGFSRRQAFVTFEGAHSKGQLRGVALLDKDGHADTTLAVTHKATHCESRELYKHILDGTSTGVFQGKVIVAPGAQKTDGKMMSRAIFLADGANMYNKPELEIFADDVVCGHGATAGYLNEEQLFYLRARGVPEKLAQALLLEAFAAEAIEDVGSEAIQAELTESVERWLRQRQG